jgi:DNA-binding MarR family transcriptional regulator
MSLLPQHTEQLDKSAIADGIRRERGYWSATDLAEWARRDGDMAKYQRRLPGLAYPVYRLGRSKPYTMMLRPDSPRTEKRDGKIRTIKYEWPSGLPLCIDILPRYRDSLHDSTIPIWFTEGSKKADSLAGLGQSIIPAALNGVWCWKSKTADGDSRPLADFDELALKGRQVVLAFDSDQAVNANVQKALKEFATFLTSRGAIVGNLKLPHGHHKLGVDDAIAGGWTFEQLSAAIEWLTLPSRTPRLMHASRLCDIPPTTWLIDGVLAMNKLSQTFAPPGAGKSFLELDKALCVSQNYPVIYVAAEAVEDYEERVAAWEAHHGIKAGQLYFWPEPIMLKDSTSVDAFLTEIHPIEPAAIFIDPLASCMVGLEESSTGDMTIAIDALNRIRRETSAAVHIVHHTGWNEDHERGNSALRAACRIVMKLSTDDGGLMTLSCVKANNGKPFEARYFRLISVADSAVPVPANKIAPRDAPLSEKQFAIMETLDLMHLRDGATFSQIQEHTNIAKSTLNKAISRLIELGSISCERSGRSVTYHNTPKGNAELAARLDKSVVGASSPVHDGSELVVNWMVNNIEIPPPDVEFTESSSSVHHDGEHGELESEPVPTEHDNTASEGGVHLVHRVNALVHPDGEQNSSPQFTPDTASESASSPEFTASSPLVHHTEFTSSPYAPPLRGVGGEQQQSEHDEGSRSSTEQSEDSAVDRLRSKPSTAPAIDIVDRLRHLKARRESHQEKNE